MTDELLTIRQTCSRLGVSDRSLRRELTRPEIKARLLTITRLTRTGPRQATVLPLDLVQDLAVSLREKREAIQTNEEVPEEVRAEFETTRRLTESYERLLAEKEQRVQDLLQQVQALEAALRREQEVVSRLGESLAEKPMTEPQRATVWTRLIGRGKT